MVDVVKYLKQSVFVIAALMAVLNLGMADPVPTTTAKNCGSEGSSNKDCDGPDGA